MTRHWVEANIDQSEAGFVLVCEHPKACTETGGEVRHLGCSVKDWFFDVGIELLEFPKDNTVLFGRVEVAASWRGYGEDAELSLVPPNSRGAASAGSHQPDTAGDPIDWKQVAVKLGQRESDWRLLSTVEAEALRPLVDAAWDREAIAEDTRIDRSTDAADGWGER